MGTKIVHDAIGNERDPAIHPSATTLSDLMIQIPDTHASGFRKWSEDFMLNGRNSASDEKTGSLDFFSPKSTKPYFSLNFDGVGIHEFAVGGSALNTNTGKPVSVVMYYERVKFSAGSAAIL